MHIEAPELRCDLNPQAPDIDEALQLCIRQAELGHANAQHELGNYWYEGLLTEKDYDQALHWYSQASVQGHAQAQLRLGIMYANGLGIAVNKAQAFIIFKMAAVNGSDEAYNHADRLTVEMSEQELELANQILSQIFRRYLQHIQQHSFELNNTP